MTVMHIDDLPTAYWRKRATDLEKEIEQIKEELKGIAAMLESGMLNIDTESMVKLLRKFL